MLMRGIRMGFQIFFYLGFVGLWFKDSFPLFRGFGISPAVFLVPLIGVTAIRLFKRWKEKPPSLFLTDRRDILFPALLVVLIAALRIPFLVHHLGLFTSDDAVPALMAKHIAEGHRPPLFFYGQIFLGSFSSHLIAAVMAVFGQSLLLVKITAFVFYPAFVLVHYRILKKVFSTGFARMVSLFYCLPLVELTALSLDNTSHFALVFFLGALMISLAHDITFGGRRRLVPALGFLMGLAFWTHEISAVFILTAGVVVLKTFRAHPKNIPVLAAFGIIGAFPVVLHNLFGTTRFLTLKFLLSGAMGDFGGEKFLNAGKLLQHLLASETGLIPLIFLAPALAGFLFLGLRSLRTRPLTPQFLYPVFFLGFAGIYVFSQFSSVPVIRYLYPLYFCLPVFLFAAVSAIRRAGLKHAAGILVLVVLCAQSFAPIKDYHQAAGERRRHREAALELLRSTGQRYWLGEYWTAYVLTALSLEDHVVASYSYERYPPYRLDYDNRQEGDRYIFITSGIDGAKAENLLGQLDAFGIAYKKDGIRDILLVHGIESPVFPAALEETDPPPPPRLELKSLDQDEGYVRLGFANPERHVDRLFRLRVEIPGFSTVTRVYQGTDDEIDASLPFSEGDFTIRWAVDFNGLVIPASVGQASVAARDEAPVPRRSGIVYLSGFGQPRKDDEWPGRLCEKRAVMEINDIQDRRAEVRLHLRSPFDFEQWWWYGDFSQKMRLFINGEFAGEYTLKHGANEIVFGFDVPSFREGRNLVELDFAYHGVFDFAELWKTAALLEGISGPALETQ
jgi:hypothetical protein